MDFTRERHQFNPEIRRKLKQLRTLDNWHGIIALLYDYSVIAVGVCFFFINPWLYPVSLLLIGSRQRALATIVHEAAHRCLARSRWLNQFIGSWLSGYLILQEFSAYCESHVKKHHGYLGEAENDPDYQYHLQQKLYDRKSRFTFLVEFIVKPMFLFKVLSYSYYLLRWRLKPQRKYIKGFVKLLVFWVVIISMSIYFQFFFYLMILWFLPLITSAAVIGWFNELSEHYPLVKVNKKDLYMSRNRYSHWVEHFILNTHNENYHLVHHLHPSIPFWHLKKAHHILLDDHEYSTWNDTMGGIFLSSNKVRPLLILLVLEQSFSSSENRHRN